MCIIRTNQYRIWNSSYSSFIFNQYRWHQEISMSKKQYVHLRVIFMKVNLPWMNWHSCCCLECQTAWQDFLKIACNILHHFLMAVEKKEHELNYLPFLNIYHIQYVCTQRFMLIHEVWVQTWNLHKQQYGCYLISPLLIAEDCSTTLQYIKQIKDWNKTELVAVTTFPVTLQSNSVTSCWDAPSSGNSP